MDHGKAVTKRYVIAQNTLDESYWDDVFREKEYFENYNQPIDNGNIERKGRCVGECDILLVNREDKVALYEEVKTGYKGLYKGNEQTERFEEFFEDTEWDLYTKVVLEQ